MGKNICEEFVEDFEREAPYVLTGLVGLVLGGIMFLSADCSSEKPNYKYLDGIVIKEFGSLVELLPSPGYLFSNESIKLGPSKYGLEIKTEEGENYIARIYPEGVKSLEALSVAIKKGSKIRFLEGIYDSDGELIGERFSLDRIGGLTSKEIHVKRSDSE